MTDQPQTWLERAMAGRLPIRATGGYVAVGNGVGAAVLANGRLNVVAGPLFSQIERERVEGPRYVEAIERARAIRGAALIDRCLLWGSRSHSLPHCEALTTDEFNHGIPVGWIGSDPTPRAATDPGASDPAGRSTAAPAAGLTEDGPGAYRTSGLREAGRRQTARAVST